MKRVTYCDLNKKQDKLLGCDGLPLPCNAKVLQCDDLPDSTPSADLAVAKTVNPSKAAPGAAVVFTVVATNAGPNAANGALVSDSILSNYLDATSATTVTITYSGGAAGPATTTVGALAAGVAITTFPMGGVATFSISTTVKANAPAAQIVNTASIVPPTGVEDPKPGNNNSAAVVDVEQCYLKCDDILSKRNNYSSAFGGVSDCLVVYPGAVEGPRIVIQARDGTLLEGDATFGQLGYIAYSFTNDFPTPALLEVEMTIDAMMDQEGLATREVKAVVISGITDVLEVLPPNNYYTHTENFVWVPLDYSDPISSSLNLGTAWPDTDGMQQGFQAQVKDTGHCRYRKTLAPGETVKVYSQWWAVLAPATPGLVYRFHCGHWMEATLTRNHGTLAFGAANNG